MKIFWWQGGLHAEPETEDERKALVLLSDGSRRSNLASESTGTKKTLHHVVSNLEFNPSGISSDFSSAVTQNRPMVVT
jgi:hypothetical protein